MITGIITPDHEAVVSLDILGPQGQQESVDAVIDTGFNGYLTLPSDLILRLSLIFHSPAIATLADGTNVLLQKYEGRLLWEGMPRDILVLEANGGPLAGMSLLHRSRVTLDVVDGGPVTIEPLP